MRKNNYYFGSLHDRWFYIYIYIYSFLSVIFCCIFNLKFLTGMFGPAAIAAIIFLRDISIILTRVVVLQTAISSILVYRVFCIIVMF